MPSRGSPVAAFGRSAAAGANALVAAIALLALTACGDRQPTVQLPGHLPAFVVTTASLNHDPLSAVLSVQRDPAHPALSPADREVLTRYLATLATVGPDSVPDLFITDTDRVAYLVNAHVAWTLALHDLGGLAPAGLRDVRRLAVPLDRGETTLEDIELQLLEVAEQLPRLVLCLNPGVSTGPPLPLAALAGHSLDWQLRDHALRCGRTPGFWQLTENPSTLRVNGFTEYVPGLPVQRSARMQRLLALVPPPPDLLAAIDDRCGQTLFRCNLGLTAPD